MKNKELSLKYSSKDLPKLLANADSQPIVIWYDDEGTQAMYRIFSVGADTDRYARRDAWRNARLNDEMTPEIAAYELGNFQAPAPYNITVSLTSKEQVYLREGDQNNNIEFTFFTADSGGSHLSESVQVVYSFNNAGATASATKIYNSGEEVVMNIDQYLSVGRNDITITVTGRSTGATRILILHYYVVSMELTSAFNVAVPQTPNTALIVPYALRCSSAGVKYIEFYIDGNLVHTATSTESLTDTSVSLDMPSQGGLHHLQISAYVEAGDGKFYSKTLYREFVVTGSTGIWISLAIDLPSGMLINTDKTNLILTAEQYVQTEITWGYYNSRGISATVRWTLGGESLRATEAQVTDAESNAEPYVLKFVPTQTGTLELKATVNESVTTYSLVVEVNKSGVQEATEGLNLKLQSLGRYNNEPADERNVWEFNGIKAIFPPGWAWSEQQGWDGNDALAVSGGKQVVIPIQPLGNAPHTNGCAIELDFMTYDVDDENDTVLSVWGRNDNGNECGIKITAEAALMQSGDGVVMKTQFKQNERIKLCFIVNRESSVTFPHLAFMTIDGVYERAVDYGSGGSYTNQAQLVLGSSTGKASIKVYNIRCYGQALSVQQEMYNHFIDSSNVAQKIIDNDIYADGNVSVEKMQGVIPVMLFDGLDTAYNNITTLEGVTDKDTKINVNVSFYNPDDPTKNFTIEGARVKLQGTSSLGYPRKNFKVYSKKDAAVMRDFEGKVIEKGLYAFKDGDVPVSTWTLKADFMDSSCTRNASVARIYGDIEPKVNIKDAAGNQALMTPPQVAASKYEGITGVKFPYNLRTTPNGQAIVCFHRLPGDKQYTFLGQYTMLNDKGNEYVYGFHSIYAPTAKGIANGNGNVVLTDPMAMWLKDSVKDALVASGDIYRIHDNARTRCYEILDNTSAMSDFSTTAGWDDLVEMDGASYRHLRIEQAFESRYPEIDDGDYLSEEERTEAAMAVFQPLADFINWMVSCKDGNALNLTRFEATLDQHLDIYKLAGYYSYLMRFGAVDQVKKNMMWTTYDGVHWFPIRYDNDSTVDKKNSGALFYSYTFTRDTEDPDATGEYCYAGHDSLLWNALEQSSRFMSIVRDVDDAFYAAGLTYEQVCDYYDKKASDMWCESVYNENMHYKYIAPLVRQINKQDWLQFLQGKDKSHRHWWLRNRFDMFDSKWGTGEFTNKSMRILAGGTPRYSKMYFTAAKSSSFGWGINKRAQFVNQKGDYSVTADRGEDFVLEIAERGLAIGDPVYIFGANNLSKIDLHELAPYLSSAIELSYMYDKELGSNLRTLIIGVADGVAITDANRNSSTDLSFSGFDVLSRLEYLNIRGLSQVVSVQFINKLSSLKTFLAEGTGMTTFTCADGVAFERLQLPATLRSMNLSRVSWKNLEYAPTTQLRTLTLEYMTAEDEFPKVKQFVFDWLDMLERTYGMDSKWGDFSLRLTGVDWTNVPYHRLQQLMNLGSCLMSGHSYIKCNTEFTNAQMTELLKAFGNNIFTDGADLVIDCDSSKLILGINAVGDTVLTMGADGITEMHERGTCQIVATGFPIRGTQEGGKIIYSILGTATYGAMIDALTGVVTANEEGYAESHVISINAYNDKTMIQGVIELRLVPLTYPTGVDIKKVIAPDGKVLLPDASGSVPLTSTGVYRVQRTLIPQGTTGTTKAFQWNYTGQNASQSSVNGQTEAEFQLWVKNISAQEIYEDLSYWVAFNNPAVDPASVGVRDTVKLCMFAILQVLVNNNVIHGNEELYRFFVQKYGITPETLNYLNSYELRNIVGDIVIEPSDNITTFKSLDYNVIEFLRAIRSIDASGAKLDDEMENVSKCDKLESVSFENNTASITFGDYE